MLKITIIEQIMELATLAIKKKMNMDMYTGIMVQMVNQEKMAYMEEIFMDLDKNFLNLKI